MKQIARRNRQVPLALGWLVTLTVAAFYMYEYFLRLMPSSMFSYFIATHGATLSEISHIETAYYWTYVPLQIFVGTIMDIYGVRKPLFLALFTCIIGCVFFSFESSVGWLILGRALIGFGSAFGFVAVLKAASIWLPKRYFPLAIGIATAMGMGGAIFGKVIFNQMVNTIGTSQSIDVATISGIGLTIISFFLVFDRHNISKKTTTQRRLSIMFKTIRTVISQPQMWLIGTVGLFLYLPTQILGLWDIYFFSSVYGIAPSAAAQISSMIYWGWVIGGPFFGFISTHMERRANLFLLGALGSALMLYQIIYNPVHAQETLMVYMFLLGFFSSTEVLVFDLAASVCNKSHAGTAVAITNMFVMLGGYFQKIVASILEADPEGTSTRALADVTQSDFQQAMMILPIGLTLTIFISLFIQVKQTSSS